MALTDGNSLTGWGVIAFVAFMFLVVFPLEALVLTWLGRRR